MSYKIIALTNGYIADRDVIFNGRTEITIESGLNLRQAQKKLLEMFNKHYETTFNNWRYAIINTKGRIFGAHSFKDGTRSYEYDSRTYRIEKDE